MPLWFDGGEDGNASGCRHERKMKWAEIDSLCAAFSFFVSEARMVIVPISAENVFT